MSLDDDIKGELRNKSQMQYAQELANATKILIHIREYIKYTRRHDLAITERNRNTDNITKARYLCSVLIEPDPNHL